MVVGPEASLGSWAPQWVRRVLSMGASKGPVAGSPELTQEMSRVLGERPKRGSRSGRIFEGQL